MSDNLARDLGKSVIGEHMRQLGADDADIAAAQRAVDDVADAVQDVGVLRLYELSDLLAQVGVTLVEGGGELTPETEALLDALTGALEHKTDRICGLIQNLGRSGEAAHAEADRLSQLASARERSAKSLKGYLLRCLERAGRHGVDTDRFRVAVCANSRPSIRWTGEPGTVPAGFRRARIELDGEAALRAWKAGTLPEGFEVHTDRHLRIR